MMLVIRWRLGINRRALPTDQKLARQVFTRNLLCVFIVKKPGHIMSACHKRQSQLAAKSSDEQPVQLVNLPPGGLVPPTTVSVPQEIDPRYRQHCVDAVITGQDCAKQSVKILQDTGALQSLVSSAVVPDSGVTFTGEKRLIRGVTGDVISVPLVEVNLTSPLCTGTYLCGYVSTLPDGIAVLIGNDLCYNQSAADVTVVI